MAEPIEEVVAILRARQDKLAADLKGATRLFETESERMKRANDDVRRRLEANSASIGSTLKRMAGTIATYFTGRELIGLTDAFTRFQNSLRVAGVDASAMEAIQGALFQSAQRYGVELEALSTLYGRAAQASSELGVSQEQLLTFTNNVAAAVRVQGGTVQQASGALLQLSQALQSGTVRAEEYNSMAEGLFPILQAAAAGSDRFGGSVARLRAAVMEGTVSSREFFNAIQAGADTLQNRAAEAALTTSAAFTQLRNALVVYFGEADQASGVSAALGEAIRRLADNIDTIIPALAMLGTALGVGFVTNAVRAAAAARGVGAALLAAFGGPIGLAITGVTVALGSFAIGAVQANRDLASVQSTVEGATEALRNARAQAEGAASSVAAVGSNASSSQGQVLAFAGAVGQAADQLYRLAHARRQAAIQDLEQRRVQASQQYSSLYARTAEGRRERGRGSLRTPIRSLRDFWREGGNFLGAARDEISARLGFGPSEDELREGMGQLRGALNNYDRALQELRSRPIEQWAPSSGGGTGRAPASGGRARAGGSGAGRQGPDPAVEERQRREEQEAIEQEILQAQQAYLQELIHSVTNAAERAQLELTLIEANRAAEERRINADERLNEAQRAELAGLNNRIADIRKNHVVQQERQRLADEQTDLTISELRNQQELERVRGRLAVTADERRASELRLLDLQYQEERARLAAVEANTQLSDATRERARRERQALEERYGYEQRDVLRSTAGPAEGFLQRLEDDARRANEAIEEIGVQGLEGLTDGLADAIAGTRSLGDVFQSVANQIIADLARIAIQQAIVGPLTGSWATLEPFQPWSVES